MRLSLYQNDYETERIFSYLRWIFVFICGFMFYYPPIDNILQFEHDTFSYLFFSGIIYICISQIALEKMDPNHKMFSLLTKTGILFDFIAYIWLLVLSGGVTSMLFPIGILIVMHATIYWQTKGAFTASFFSSVGYLIIFLQEPSPPQKLWFILGMNLIFIWVVGLFGSLIVLRERKHFKMKEIYHELVVTDYLTGLYNHRHFQEHLRHLTDRKTPYLLIMGDIDHFKSINDQYGHLVGDEVLRSIGKIFSKIAADFEGQAFRYGGEELAFLLPASAETKLSMFLETVFHELNLAYFTTEKWTITMSFGVALWREEYSSNEIISIADDLLYKAKSNGKNRACLESGFCYRNEEKNSAINKTS
ncbi:Diguanylate cyclase, GGDEF domain [Bacillus sp. cl95]|nr:Diguanylate cyclase, GGDEF domain [Bacillus sp. UNCCL13]SFQ63284.1 Diguanylate cyclase, GGDEF domain [Bacillus sp. cl95]